MGGDALVPEGLGDFRRVAFWDGFFATRAAKAFEWYGEWRQLRPLALALCRGRTILVPGCGNSSLSADMCAAPPPPHAPPLKSVGWPSCCGNLPWCPWLLCAQLAAAQV